MSEAQPALAAYTVSAQASGSSASTSKRGGSSDRQGRDAKSKSKQPLRRPTGKGRRFINKEKLEFDDKARADYLTGFHKRKVQRIENAQKKRAELAKEERKQARRETVQAKKERAAENVLAERKAYGGSDEEDDEDDDGRRYASEGNSDDDSMQQQDQPTAYDGEQYHTTVTVTEWDPNAPDDEPMQSSISAPSSSKVKGKAKAVEVLPPSSKRMEKKAKAKGEQSSHGSTSSNPRSSKTAGRSSSRPKTTALPAASSISTLLSSSTPDSRLLPELSSAPSSANAFLSHQDQASQLNHLSSHSERSEALKKIKDAKPFRYETKLERAKQKASHKLENERRKQERIEKAKRVRASGGAKGKKRK